MSEKLIETLSGSILAGLSCACPRCGKGKLFQGFLTLRPRCEVCGLDYGFADSGDGPAVFIMFLAGFIVVGAALVTEAVYHPPYWVHAVLWLPLDPDRHAWTIAADEGADDRAAVPSQGRGGALRRQGRQGRRASDERSGKAAAVVARAAHPGRAGLCGPRWAWDLADSAQGVEGGVDRFADRAARRAPIALPSPATWPSLDPATDEYRRVTFSAEFDHAKEALVFAAASAFRPDVSGPGYWVFTPARLADGSLLIVNRGFVPEGRQDPKSRPDGQISGAVEIVGAMRWPDGAQLVHAERRAGAQPLVLPRPPGDRRRQGPWQRGAVLRRAGNPRAAGRIAASRQACGEHCPITTYSTR